MTVMTAPLAKTGDTTTYSFQNVPPPASLRSFVDPLDADLPGDDVVVTTRRAISRVALVATEAGGRFQREGVAHDPMTWMLTPRALFAGASALDACLHRDACLRGVLLHGLSLGLDADPADIDALTDDEDEDLNEDDRDFDGDSELLIDLNLEDDGDDAEDDSTRVPGVPPSGGPDEEPRLFTAMIVANDGFEILQAFHASLATEEAEIAGRLYMRMGAAMADAVIVDGFDPTAPLVAALVSSAICDTLALVAADPASPLAAGLDLNIEQRFLS